MKTKDLVTDALMIAILVIASQLSIPVQPVPITLQTLAVSLIGLFLRPKHAIFTTLGYMILGLVGLPVFSGFSGGLQSVLSPSFGFVISFIAAAGIQSYYLEKQDQVGLKEIIWSLIINFLITYAIGLPYMVIILNVYLGSGLGFWAILMAGLIPFIPGSIAKAVVAAIIGKQLYPRFRQTRE